MLDERRVGKVSVETFHNRDQLPLSTLPGPIWLGMSSHSVKSRESHLVRCRHVYDSKNGEMSPKERESGCCPRGTSARRARLTCAATPPKAIGLLQSGDLSALFLCCASFRLLLSTCFAELKSKSLLPRPAGDTFSLLHTFRPTRVAQARQQVVCCWWCCFDTLPYTCTYSSLL